MPPQYVPSFLLGYDKCAVWKLKSPALSPFIEPLGEACRILHGQTLPALRQLDRRMAEMLAHPIPLVAVGPTGEVSVVGSPPIDQVWVTPTAGADGQLRRRAYYLPSVPRVVRLLGDMEHELFMIGRHTAPMITAVRSKTQSPPAPLHGIHPLTERECQFTEIADQERGLSYSSFDFGEGPEHDIGQPRPSRAEIGKCYEEMGDIVTIVVDGERITMNQARARVKGKSLNHPLLQDLRAHRSMFGELGG